MNVHVIEGYMNSNCIPVHRCECSPIYITKYELPCRDTLTGEANLHTPEFKTGLSGSNVTFKKGEIKDNMNLPSQLKQDVLKTIFNSITSSVPSSIFVPGKHNNDGKTVTVTNHIVITVDKNKKTVHPLMIRKKRVRKFQPPRGVSSRKKKEIPAIPCEKHRHKLNEIILNGQYLKKFPLFNFDEKEISVNLNYSLLKDQSISVSSKDATYFLRKSVLKQNQFREFLSKEQEKLDFLIAKQLENDCKPQEQIRTLYAKIKSTIKALSKNSVMKNHKTVHDTLLSECQFFIEKCNKLSDAIINAFNRTKLFYQKRFKHGYAKKKKSPTSKRVHYFSSYPCEWCERTFSTGQGLGGHMSRVHPRRSDKYKDKMRIRKSRTAYRIAAIDSKKILLSRYSLNYDKLIQNNSKSIIRETLKKHFKEYRDIFNSIKHERGLN